MEAATRTEGPRNTVEQRQAAGPGSSAEAERDLGNLDSAHSRNSWLLKAVDKRLRDELAKLHIQINEEKGRTVDLAQGENFGFMGFDFRRVRSLQGKWRARYTPKLQKRTALLQQRSSGATGLKL